MLPKVFKITGFGLARNCCKHHANERFYYSSKVLQIPCKLRGSCSIMLPKAYKMTDSSSSAANTMRKKGLVLAPRFGKSYANWQVQAPKCCEYKANSQYQDRNNEHLSKKIPKQFPTSLSRTHSTLSQVLQLRLRFAWGLHICWIFQCLAAVTAHPQSQWA